MSDHHECGPSALYRRQACPASMLAERGLPEESGPDAEEGTILHEKVVEVYERGESAMEGLTDEQAEAVSRSVSFLRSFDGRGGEPWIFEERLVMFDECFQRVNFGRLDAVKVIQEEGMGILVDFKFGRNPVSSPAMNLQFANYAAMIAQEYGVSRVECHLVQPRLFEKAEPFTFTKFDGIVKTIKRIIARCNELDAERRAGEHCKYCKAKSGCPAFGSFSTAVATLNSSAITADNAADLAGFITQLRKQCDRATDMLKEAVKEAGGQLGNLRLVHRAGNRCADSKELFGCVRDNISADEYMALVDPRIAQVEDLYATRLKESGLVKTKKEGAEKFNQLPAISRKESCEILQVVRS